MLNALLYLKLTSAKNWAWSRLRRLRQPKYLLGAIVGSAYFYFFFFRTLTRPQPDHGAMDPATAEALQAAAAALPADWLPVTTALGGVLLLVCITLMWLLPRQRASLGFTEPEIAFLFPAPITRRGLVHFRLSSAQFRSFLGAAVLMLFSSRWAFLGGNLLTHVIGWWFVFSTLTLHFNGSSFTITRLSERGVAGWQRRLVVVAGVAIVIGTTLARLPGGAHVPEVTGPFNLRPFADWLVMLTTTAPLAWVLWPLYVVVGPFLAADWGGFLVALAPALAVITAHYLWVVRAAVSFEDATIEDAQRRAARTAAWHAGDQPVRDTPAKRRRAPFRLAPTGRPEIAFLWKNLLSTWPYFSLRVLAGCAFAITTLSIWLNRQPEWRGLLPVMGALALLFAGYVLVVGPQFARQDIRTDLPNTDILKIYPLAGWQVVFGQLLAPTAILSGILWLALLTIALGLDPSHAGLAWLTPQLRIASAVALAAIVPALVMLQLLVPNAAALLFPAWFQASRGRGGGPEVVGQRMIFFFAQLLAMIIALLPAVSFAALLLVIFQWLLGPLAAVAVAAGVMLVVLLGELWLGVWWLGRRFDQLDLSSDLLP